MKRLSRVFAVLAILVLPQAVSAQFIFWDEMQSGVTVSLNSVSNLDGNTAFLCGDSGTVLRTINYGYNWTKTGQNGIPASVKLNTIFAYSQNLVLTGGLNGSDAVVYHTSNSGANWTRVFKKPGTVINAIYFFSASSGIMIGNPAEGRWSIFKTTDSGLSWDTTGCFLPQAGNESGFVNSYSAEGSKIWFGTDNSRLYYSSNSGTNWNAISTTPLQNVITTFLSTNTNSYSYAAGSSMMKSTNSGSVWIQDSLAPGTGDFNLVGGKLYFQGLAWYIRSSSSIYWRMNFYSNWQVNYTAPSGIYTHFEVSRGAYIIGPGLVFAVRNNGKISRGNAVVEGVRMLEQSVPGKFNLYQNYPNPFNSRTNFRFDAKILPGSGQGEMRGGNIKLVIYNSLGEEIETLIDKVIQPGIYEAGWDGSKHASGVYFYRMLVTNPNYSGVVFDEVKRMVMIK